jgi:4-hydroxy-3-methylbut-2-en-1-yl diphosphate reductase
LRVAKTFDIPGEYRSDIIASIKRRRAEDDRRKVDFSPSRLSYGRLELLIARFFGLCYGVENAIEVAYRAVRENPGRRVFLISEMIHNPRVNADLEACGVRFLMTTAGKEEIPLSELTGDDVMIVPAFGAPLELFERMRELGVKPIEYDATCPFVEKVWKRGSQLGAAGFSIVLHGKFTHEETRATLSRVQRAGPAVVVLNRDEAQLLCDFIEEKVDATELRDRLGPRMSRGFDPDRDLARLGVVNQTTMLAEETHEISFMLRDALVRRYGAGAVHERFADTRDTLCYATSENQRAMRTLVSEPADFALVVGGYNSSNTSHLVEIAEGHLPTFYIKDADELVSHDTIRHFSPGRHELVTTQGWLPLTGKLKVLISAGASCPDSLVEGVVTRIAELAQVQR